MQTAQTNNGLIVQGRLVWTVGRTPHEGKAKTDYNSGAVILDETGQPQMQYGFGLAIAKVDPRTGQTSEQFTKVWQALHAEAFTLYPSGQLPPDFAMKYKDGDAVDHNGKPFETRDGYKGHIILACTTEIPPKFFRYEGGNNIMVNDGFKCGDYVNVQLNLKAHPPKGRGKPGLYLNPSAVQLIQAGKEIINAPSGDQLFGQQAPVFNGVVEAHTGPTMPNMAPAAPQAPQMPQQGFAAPMAPAQPQYPAQAPQAPQMPQQPAQPHYGVLPQTHQPQPPMGAPAMPQYPAQPPMQPAAPQYPAQAPQMPQQGYAPAAPQYAPQAPAGMPGMPGMPPMPR